MFCITAQQTSFNHSTDTVNSNFGINVTVKLSIIISR